MSNTNFSSPTPRELAEALSGALEWLDNLSNGLPGAKLAPIDTLDYMPNNVLGRMAMRELVTNTLGTPAARPRADGNCTTCGQQPKIGRVRTLQEQLRADGPVCSACHQFLDPMFARPHGS